MQSGADEGLAKKSRPIIWDAAACVRAGVATQAGALVLVLGIQSAIFSIYDPEYVARATFVPESFRFAAVVWPPVLLFSAINSNVIYRHAVGAFTERAALTNAMIVILLTIMVLPVINIVGIPLGCLVIWLLSRRKLLLDESEAVGWATPGMLLLITALIAMFDAISQRGRGFIEPFYVVNAILSMMLADALTVNIAAVLKRREKLAPSPARVFQFSLNAIFLLSLLAGAWGVLLVNVL